MLYFSSFLCRKNRHIAIFYIFVQISFTLAEPLKNMYNDAFLGDYTDTLKSIILNFNEKSFLQNFGTKAWHDMELKQRVAFLDKVTDEVLPEDYDKKMKAIENIIHTAKKKGVKDQNFIYIFLCDIVARHGISDIEKAAPHI